MGVPCGENLPQALDHQTQALVLACQVEDMDLVARIFAGRAETYEALMQFEKAEID